MPFNSCENFWTGLFESGPHFQHVKQSEIQTDTAYYPYVQRCVHSMCIKNHLLLCLKPYGLKNVSWRQKWLPDLWKQVLCYLLHVTELNIFCPYQNTVAMVTQCWQCLIWSSVVNQLHDNRNLKSGPVPAGDLSTWNRPPGRCASFFFLGLRRYLLKPPRPLRSCNTTHHGFAWTLCFFFPSNNPLLY